ncbi:SusD family protein [Chitinophaga jiangningensis]|uniref:SusD family protein n=1 Tax=Chitinophaga jiangningensis TaxID=1419482 RepID=A0A1M7AEF2_9BACT|nr:RagB/SusD family nutrient uptake outer membrane protein [Chitinophaga jiangningensis]SHL41151.1 SusD family protein [Chitinophaga jiangningensis]
MLKRYKLKGWQAYGFSRSILAVALLLTLSNVSCTKFLEEPVDNRTLIVSLDDMEETLNQIMPYSDYHFTDIMSDDYIFRDLAGHNVEEAVNSMLPIFELEICRQSLPATRFLASGFNPVTAFRRSYNSIINSLLILDKLKGFTPTTKEEETRAKALRGKALAIRAYSNYMLVNLFAKQYNPATAATDKGIPFVAAYSGEPVVGYKQESVQKVYDEILKDLLEAVTLVEAQPAKNAQFNFGADAVNALLSRVYLNKKDWDNSIKYATAVLDKRSAPLNIKTLRNSITDYQQYSSAYFNPSNPSFILMGNNTYQLIAYFWMGMFPYPAVQMLRDEGADDDNNYTIQTSPLYSDYVPQKLMLFQPTATRNGNMPVLTVDEVLFNRAEAAIEKAKGMTAQAQADLTALINNQTFSDEAAADKINLLPTLTTRDQAIGMLLLIKRIRFTSEGMRWFDMRRHNIPVSHKGRSGTYTIDGTKPEDYVIQLPTEEITRNPGL